MINQDFERHLKGLVSDKLPRIEILTGIKTGSFSKNDVRQIASTLYAEAKSALQIKIPERIRICPIELGNVRRFWCRILNEESGGFRFGKDHASLIYPTCMELGSTPDDLNAAYEIASEKLSGFRQLEVSVEITIRELCRMWIDEYILALEANNIGDALKLYYGVSESGVYYFRLHAIEDIKHSNEGLKQIVAVSDSLELQDYAFKVVSESLDKFPIWA